MNKKKWMLIVACVVVLAAIVYALMGGKKEAPVMDYETARVEKATIGNSVTATGTIEPVTKVEVGTQVSGIIDKIYVDYNSVVHKGQIIAELDKTNLMSELNSAKSNLAGAKSDLDYQRANYKRIKALYDKELVSGNEYDTALLSLRQAESTYAQRKEAVSKAQTNLGYAIITSPIDGIIISKAVEEGQTVAASYSTPTLFTIAQDLTDMRVIADVDEADIGEVEVGQRVSFTVDAYPGETFEGQVTQVRLEATTESNVVTYEVVISASNKDLKLKPGLTANVTIYTQERAGVMGVSSKALRFTPTPETVGKQYKIQDVANAKAKVWTLEGNVLQAHRVSTGMNDGVNTEILSGVKAGLKVITGITVTEPEEDKESDAQEQSPFAPGPKRDNKKEKA